MPMVTISGWTRSRTVSAPFKAPISVPISSTAATTGTTRAGSPSIRPEVSIAATVTMPSIDRSMPPVRMTRVWPRLTKPSPAACSNTLVKLRSVPKRSLKAAPIATSATSRPTTIGSAGLIRRIAWTAALTPRPRAGSPDAPWRAP